MSHADKMRAERYLDRVRALEVLVERLRGHLAEAVALGATDEETDALADAAQALLKGAQRERRMRAAADRHRDIDTWRKGRHVPVTDVGRGTPVAIQPMGVRGHPGTAWTRWLA